MTNFSIRFWFVAASLLLLPVHPLAASTTSADELWNSGNTPTNAGCATNHIIVKQTNGQRISVPVDSADQVDDAVNEWDAQASTAYAECDPLVHAYGQETSWGTDNVQAVEAASTNGATGLGMIVAVVDSGVDYAHEDLNANRWINIGETADDGIDNDSNGYVDDVYGYDFIGSLYTSVAPDSEPQDEFGHGTHVAGIIAAEDNSIGVRGVAPSAAVMAVKVLDSEGYGYDSNIADGIRYAVDNGADIINLSLGSSLASNTLKEAVDYAVAAGVLVVAAAGNENSFTLPSYPANYAGVVSVGALTEDGEKAYFSNWGKVDIMAPGDDILSTTPGDTYTSYSGTSMASPFVAGVAALVAQTHALTTAAAIRQVLETTADDFGNMTGSDYVSGYGSVNALAATGTLNASSYLYADGGFILADGSDDIIVTVSVRDSSGNAVNGDNVTWSTSTGTLSASNSTTGVDGTTSVTFTADDTEGLATITATPTSTTGNTIAIAVLPDTVTPDNIGVNHYGENNDEAGTDFSDMHTQSYPGPDDINAFMQQNTSLSNNLFAAGDEITIWAEATTVDGENHHVQISYTVTDPSGTSIDALTGTTETIDLSTDWYSGMQQQINSAPLTIPTDAANGEYTLNVTITDIDSEETATRSTNFWIGELPTILVVDNSYCGDTTIYGWSAGGVSTCSTAGHTVADTLTSLGYSVMLWNSAQLYEPLDTDLLLFPAVIWLDTAFNEADSSVLQSYLDQGGNLLLSSESLASAETWETPSDFLWNYAHARYISTLFHPETVLGTTGGAFDGVTLNTNYFDLNGDSAHTNFSAEEIAINADDSVDTLFAYTNGNSTEKIAGLRVDNSTYRLVYLTFGIESINDDGDTTKASVLDTLTTWLLGNGAHITKVKNRFVNNNTDETVRVRGTNFLLTGTTHAYLNGMELSTVTVVDREHITATVPAGLPTGRYTFSLVMPDGTTLTAAKKVHIQKGGPIISNLSVQSISNNIDRTVQMNGQNFKPRSRVFFGKKRMDNVVFMNPYQMTVTIPAGFTPQRYRVHVKNPSGLRGSLHKKIRVRFGFTEELSQGISNAAVLYLEKRLHGLYLLKREADQVFDETTEHALLRFQLNHGLQQTGVLDYLTRVTLNATKETNQVE
ncbi:MAG: S8 family serine peptidase [Candidatus Kerfeldbacteria bacterium]|nr:S8 family serine peptidase [Candidatus Kerfeldbacteria bacterium]